MVFFGSLHEAKTVWDLGDIGVGSMAWINVIAILLLSPKVFKLLKSFEKQKKQGKEPEFHPDEMNIKGADFWEKKKNDNV
jgi:AGCS family alanine or glycine:cation symporter